MRSAVILTRAEGDNTALAALLRARGHHVVELPCIATLPLEDDAELASAIRALVDGDRLVVTSHAGALAVLRVLDRPLAAGVATVGRRAAEALRAKGIVVDRTAATGRELAHDLEIPPGLVLLARSDRALPDLPALLAARGATVREVVAYRTVPRVDGDAARVEALLSDGATLVLASPSALDALLERLGTAALSRARLIATGPTTAAHVEARTGRAATLASWDRVPEVVG